MRANQQSQTARVREGFRKALRKKELERQFQEHREQWRAEAQRAEKQRFEDTYPLIDEHNYHQHLPFLLHFATHPDYSFMLLPLAAHPYEAFLADPTSDTPLLILYALSQYEEIELPQTEQFTLALMSALERQEKAVLGLIANLVAMPRYSQELRDLLLWAGFLEKTEELLGRKMEQEGEKEARQLFFSSCCDFLQSHPQLDLTTFTEVVQAMRRTLSGDEQEAFMLCLALGSIGSSFQPDSQLANLLLMNFQEVFVRHYTDNELEILQFALFLVRSAVLLPQPLFQLVFESLHSHNAGVVERALTIFQMYVSQWEEFEREDVYAEMKQMELVGRLRGLMAGGKAEVKRECLLCLDLLACSIALDQQDLDQPAQLVSILAGALQQPSLELILPSLTVLLRALKAAHDQQAATNHFLILAKREGLKLVVQPLSQLQECKELVGAILTLMKQ